jgi:hypothetical protein
MCCTKTWLYVSQLHSIIRTNGRDGGHDESKITMIGHYDNHHMHLHNDRNTKTTSTALTPFQSAYFHEITSMVSINDTVILILDNMNGTIRYIDERHNNGVGIWMHLSDSFRNTLTAAPGLVFDDRTRRLFITTKTGIAYTNIDAHTTGAPANDNEWVDVKLEVELPNSVSSSMITPRSMVVDASLSTIFLLDETSHTIWQCSTFGIIQSLNPTLLFLLILPLYDQ